MTNAFQVAAHRDACAEDETGVPYLVVVFESGRPGIVGHLRVLRVEEGGVHLLRIAWAQVTSEDEEAALHETLDNGMWWHRALEAVLEHLIFDVPAQDVLNERRGNVLYGWVGGQIQEVTVAAPLASSGAEPRSDTPMTQDADLPELEAEALERFFTDLSELLERGDR